MSSQTPIVRQISWLATLPQLVALGAATSLGYWLNGRDGLVLGGMVYLIYSIGSRRLLPRAHRSGIKLSKQRRFEEAIAKFQQSFDFFERHSWIDRFRSVVLMSPSAISYREMALANIAFCYGQLGDGERCRSYYDKCLQRYPNSAIAATSLRMLDSVEQSPTN